MALWKEITTIEEWNDLWEKSSERPFVVLKHSTRCPVSTNALEEFEAYLQDEPNKDYDYILVKVIEARPVSNQIAEDTGVKHESPQVISVNNKQRQWSTSHWSATKAHMKAVLD